MAAPGNNFGGTSIAAQNGAPNSTLIPEGNSEKQVVLMGLVHKKQKWRGQWVERFFQVEDTKLTYKYPMNKVGTPLSILEEDHFLCSLGKQQRQETKYILLRQQQYN